MSAVTRKCRRFGPQPPARRNVHPSMRKTGRILRVLSLGSFCALGSAQAQVQLPPVSPAASVKAVVGLTEVEISYHRPGVKGRKIFGAMLPWGEVWRLGANEATTIRFRS